MLSLRGRYASHALQRGMASLQAVARESVAVAPLSDAGASENARQGRRRRRLPIPPQRPSISSSNPRKWNRPISEGAIPAYDLALKVLRTDSIRLSHEADNLKTTVNQLEQKVLELGGWGSEGARDLESELEKKREKLRILQVQSQVNLPDVRWRVANGMVDMSNPTHRHLLQQRWRSDGDLDLLMERIHQMHVIPDVLPDLRPTIDVRVATLAPNLQDKTSHKKYSVVEPGTFLQPEWTLKPPGIYANVFHTDTRLYTLLLVDPDVPDEATQSFCTYLHWLKPNIPLSASHRTRIEELNTHTAYIPPHPQRGTPYHRYVLLLLLQPPLEGTDYSLNTEARAKAGVATSMHLDIPVVEGAARKDFDVRGFMDRWGLDGAQGGGAHMWRELWTSKVSTIYTDILKEPEPRYGRQPKENPYSELKHRKRYDDV